MPTMWTAYIAFALETQLYERGTDWACYFTVINTAYVHRMVLKMYKNEKENRL